MTLRWLIDAVLGSIPIDALLCPHPNVARRLANSKRKRRPHICYPLRR
jgi:hypothetical protein